MQVSPSNILLLFGEMIRANILRQFQVDMLTFCISRPNRTLMRYHNSRLNFLRISFLFSIHHETNVHKDNYIFTCFVKISEYFIQVDQAMSYEMTQRHLLPYIKDANCVDFVDDVLKYMGLLKCEGWVVVDRDISSSLILLEMIVSLNGLPVRATQKLYVFSRMESTKFTFCTKERDQLIVSLEKSLR